MSHPLITGWATSAKPTPTIRDFHEIGKPNARNGTPVNNLILNIHDQYYRGATNNENFLDRETF
jgi:hypothetical protein